MASWQKIKFFWKNLLSQPGAVITATSVASGYSVNNLSNMLEVNSLKANDVTDPYYIKVDVRACAMTTADYISIAGHNLGTINASVTLQHSDDDVTYSDIFPAVSMRSDKIFLKEFTKTASKLFWQLKITGHNAAPEIAILSFGPTTELDYASTSFDPNAQRREENVNLSYGGYLAGIHRKYTERKMSLRFDDVYCVTPSGTLADGSTTAGGTITAGADIVPTLYDKIVDWWENSGAQFFVGWERGNKPDEVYLMRSEGEFNNPLKSGGAYRDITINLIGRKE